MLGPTCLRYSCQLCLFKDLTLDIAHNLQCRAIIAANVPLKMSVEDLLEKRGITCVKSYISNGGAVISDSVEKYFPENLSVGIKITYSISYLIGSSKKPWNI